MADFVYKFKVTANFNTKQPRSAGRPLVRFVNGLVDKEIWKRFPVEFESALRAKLGENYVHEFSCDGMDHRYRDSGKLLETTATFIMTIDCAKEVQKRYGHEMFEKIRLNPAEYTSVVAKVAQSWVKPVVKESIEEEIRKHPKLKKFAVTLCCLDCEVLKCGGSHLIGDIAAVAVVGFLAKKAYDWWQKKDDEGDEE